MAAEWRLRLEDSNDVSCDNGFSHLLNDSNSSGNIRLHPLAPDTQKIGGPGAENDVIVLNVDEVLQGSLNVSGPVPCRLEQVVCPSRVSSTQPSSSEQTKSAVKQTGACKSSEVSSTRRSERSTKLRRSFSPTITTQKPRKAAKKRKRGSTAQQGFSNEHRLFDIGPDGKPFCCELCQSPYICKPGHSWRRSASGVPKYKPLPRYSFDKTKGRDITLCNACGLSRARRGYSKPVKPVPQGNDREMYLEEVKQFSQNLAIMLNDTDAQRLACPHFITSKNQACGCLQRYILAEGDQEDTVSRKANTLLKLLKEAKVLSAQKCYNVEEVTSKKGRQIGLGNGQKKSKHFQDFVLKNRKMLREDLKLCERACQKVLIYSNNFIHKRLKTEELNCRVQRTKGKAALGLLKPIEELPKEPCCQEHCTMMGVSHGRLLQEWRERVKLGQQEAKRVLAEMLTPSCGGRTNCYQFISMVTGCSMGTICKVCDHMRKTHGDRSPPEHGLRKYWKERGKSVPEGENGGELEHGSDTLVDSQMDQDIYSDIPSIDMPHTQTSETDLGLGPNTDVMYNITVEDKIQMDSESQMRQQLLQFQQQLLAQQATLQKQQALIDRQLSQIFSERPPAADCDGLDRLGMADRDGLIRQDATDHNSIERLEARDHDSSERLEAADTDGMVGLGATDRDGIERLGTTERLGAAGLAGSYRFRIDKSSSHPSLNSNPLLSTVQLPQREMLHLSNSQPSFLGATVPSQALPNRSPRKQANPGRMQSGDKGTIMLDEHTPSGLLLNKTPPEELFHIPDPLAPENSLEKSHSRHSQSLLRLLTSPSKPVVIDDDSIDSQLDRSATAASINSSQDSVTTLPTSTSSYDMQINTSVGVSSSAAQFLNNTPLSPQTTSELVQILNPTTGYPSTLDLSSLPQGTTITDITLPLLEDGSVVSIPPMNTTLPQVTPHHGNSLLPISTSIGNVVVLQNPVMSAQESVSNNPVTAGEFGSSSIASLSVGKVKTKMKKSQSGSSVLKSSSVKHGQVKYQDAFPANHVETTPNLKSGAVTNFTIHTNTKMAKVTREEKVSPKTIRPQLKGLSHPYSKKPTTSTITSLAGAKRLENMVTSAVYTSVTSATCVAPAPSTTFPLTVTSMPVSTQQNATLIWTNQAVRSVPNATLPKVLSQPLGGPSSFKTLDISPPETSPILSVTSVPKSLSSFTSHVFDMPGTALPTLLKTAEKAQVGAGTSPLVTNTMPMPQAPVPSTTTVTLNAAPPMFSLPSILQQLLAVSQGSAQKQTTLIHLSPSQASNVIAQLSNIASSTSSLTIPSPSVRSSSMPPDSGTGPMTSTTTSRTPATATSNIPRRGRPPLHKNN